jgi:hypothetical protein
LSFYEGVGVGVLKIKESELELEVLKIKESESEISKIEESESELLCTNSTALIIPYRQKRKCANGRVVWMCLSHSKIGGDTV